jgi:hypothetical protein
MSVGTGETEHYNSVLETTVSYPGIHKWEPDIYIGFSVALHTSTITKILAITMQAQQLRAADPCHERHGGPVLHGEPAYAASGELFL